MIKFDITRPDIAILEGLKYKIDNKTKPLGSLGMLEDVAIKIGGIQQTLYPQLEKPTILVFAGDHGIAKESLVNPYPQEVTTQMVHNFLAGGAAINTFCKQHELNLLVVDAGVNHTFDSYDGLIDAKIDFGTQNYLNGPAMTEEQCNLAIQQGSNIIDKLNDEGTNVVGIGEMGIGNTSSSALLMHCLTNIPLNECVGKGTGLDEKGVNKKLRTLLQVIDNQKSTDDPFVALQRFGGFEIAMMVGAYLKAAELKMLCVVDGFISSAALLVAHKMYPDVLSYCIFSHESEEKGHQLLLEHLKAIPLLALKMRLGEASGTAICFPLLISATTFLEEMASFEEADVSKSE